MGDKNLAAAVVAEVKKAIVGKDDVLVKVLVAILARGHILLEDIPGVGKTTMALAFAKALAQELAAYPEILKIPFSAVTGEGAEELRAVIAAAVENSAGQLGKV